MAYRMTKTERIARERMIYHMWQLSKDDDLVDIELRDHVPEAWHSLALDIDCDEPKEKITLYLDRSVVRAFKAMGKGYHARINRLLQTWLQLKMAGKLEIVAAIEKRRIELELKQYRAENAGEPFLSVDADESLIPKEDPGEW